MRIFLFVILILFTPIIVMAQQVTKKQHNDLVKQRERAMQLSAKASKYRMEYAYEMSRLGQMCKDVIRQNGWPDGTQCNPDTLDFIAPQPKSAQEAPVKQEEHNLPN